MRVEPREPPRQFTVGRTQIELSHVADIELEPDELVTFRTPSGTEYDVVRKTWGYYATPSLDQRLPEHGLNPVLVRNQRNGNHFVLLVDSEMQSEFEVYCSSEDLEVAYKWA